MIEHFSKKPNYRDDILFIWQNFIRCALSIACIRDRDNIEKEWIIDFTSNQIKSTWNQLKKIDDTMIS